MIVVLNGKPYSCPENTTLQCLIELLDLHNKRLAVEVNLEIVPRSAYSDHILKETDRVEIVHAIGGGCVTTDLEYHFL